MKKILAHIKSPAVALLHDILMIPLAWFLAYFLRFNLGIIPHEYFIGALKFFPVLVVVQIIFYWRLGLYKGVWRYASIPDLIQIIKAVIGACLVTALILFLFARLHGIPRSIFPLYGILMITLLSSSRLLYRYIKDHGRITFSGKRILIVGAGQAGEALARDLSRTKQYYPVAFIDDAQHRQKKKIHEVPIVGKCKDISTVVKKYDIELVVIAIPSANAEQMRMIVRFCRDASIPFQTLPGINDLADGRVTISELREVALEDLLGREQVTIDRDNISNNISGKKILVSGGGGSIGSELCRQIAQLNPAGLIVLDNSEFNLYSIEMELREYFPNLAFEAYLVDVVDKEAVEYVFDKCKPEIVFHAAAYKHVPTLEKQVRAAIKNNVLGTSTIANEAIRIGVEKFVLISSDKAVNSTNVMGATKRVAEMVCQNLNGRTETKFIVVRFGNVLGSVGSVVPLFKKQLKKGGPITVTHPDIIRYFMTIPESVSLILQSCVQGEGGETFVLDMGQPIKIQEIAEQMIRLSGKRPGIDIEIKHVGLRPGEKMYEELFYQNEEHKQTEHKKIFQATAPNTDDFVIIERLLNDLENNSLLSNHEYLQNALSPFIVV